MSRLHRETLCLPRYSPSAGLRPL